MQKKLNKIQEKQIRIKKVKEIYKIPKEENIKT